IEFALNLADSQLDQVQAALTTQNSMAFDTAPYDPVKCSYCPRGRTYFLSAENLTVTQYYFNNFPIDATSDNHVAMTEVPWPGWQPNQATYKSYLYTSGYVDPSGNSWPSPYIDYTLFAHDGFFDAGGVQRTDLTDFASVTGALSGADPPRYVVRYQLFGVPAEVEGNVKTGTNLGAYLACGDTALPGAQALIPPPSCKQLIADSNVNGLQEQGGMYIYSYPGEGPSDAYYPYFFDHYTAKILETKVYRMPDFANPTDGMSPPGEFYDGTHFIREVASASVLLEGRLQLK
ncbi:MAG: hypothetical protein KGR26_04580, partial [Cyanobacteria bacterium REEB65]|nr:hypothetical protein [Cyanobacteria bacterium REEB65]